MICRAVSLHMLGRRAKLEGRRRNTLANVHKKKLQSERLPNSYRCAGIFILHQYDDRSK
jgi:hypothetical protein